MAEHLVSSPLHVEQKTETIHDIPTPKVIYHESLKTADVPYEAFIDQRKLGLLFKENGLTDEQIKKITITLRNHSPFTIGRLTLLGMYTPFDNMNITVYLNPIWKRYEKKIDKTKKLLHEIQSEEIEGSETKRGGNKKLLKNIPLTASGDEIEKIIQNERNEFFNFVIVHESKHLIDFQNPEFKKKAMALLTAKAAVIFGLTGCALYYGGPLAGGLTYVGSTAGEYLVDPLEIRARRFTKQYHNNSRFQNIASMNSK